jgi:hypothetical protein
MFVLLLEFLGGAFLGNISSHGFHSKGVIVDVFFLERREGGGKQIGVRCAYIGLVLYCI